MYFSQPFTLARLSLLILICAHVATAQYRLESWTNDNGLPQNTVRSITQTRDGYLWLTTTIPTGANPYGLAVTPNGAFVYVVNNSDATVSVISTATNTVTATVSVGEVGIGPVHIAFAVRTQGPTGKDQCKQDGWKTFTNPSFKNEGDCVSFVNHMDKANH